MCPQADIGQDAELQIFSPSGEDLCFVYMLYILHAVSF